MTDTTPPAGDEGRERETDGLVRARMAAADQAGTGDAR